MILLYVALGSALGGVSRYLLGGFLQLRADTAFPIGTLVVNVTGSFLMGFFARYAMETPDFSPLARAFLTAGFCGGYTTFSTFSYESFQLLEQGSYGKAATYMLSSLLVALAATVAGVLAARQMVE